MSPGPVAVSDDGGPKCKPWAVSNCQDLSCIAYKSFCILKNLKTYGIIQVKEKNCNGNYKYLWTRNSENITFKDVGHNEGSPWTKH